MYLTPVRLEPRLLDCSAIVWSLYLIKLFFAPRNIIWLFNMYKSNTPFFKLIFQFLIFWCLTHALNTWIHLQEDGCIYSHSTVSVTCINISSLVDRNLLDIQVHKLTYKYVEIEWNVCGIWSCNQTADMWIPHTKTLQKTPVVRPVSDMDWRKPKYWRQTKH